MPTPTTTEELLHAFDSLIGMIRKASDVKQSLETFFKDDEWQISREFIPELIELFEEQIDADALASYAAQLREHYASLRTAAFCDCIAHIYDCVKVPEQEGILKTYSEWFPALDCNSMPIQSLSDQISQCQNIESLQSWMRFASIDQQCSDHEMKDYLAFIESQHVAPNEIVPIYRKSFLTKWLMDIMSLKGAMREGDYGLFITLSHYTKNAQKYLANTPIIRGIDGDELVGLVLKYYEELDEKYRRMIPLKMVYIPVVNPEE